LLTSIAHEINQPLAAIANNSSACVRWLDSRILEEARQSASLVIADAHRAGEIISRIRALAKNAPPQMVWLDLNQTIPEVIAIVDGELKRTGVLLETRLADDLPLIRGDRVQLQEVLLNLVINAVEAVSVTEAPRELWITSAKVSVTEESERRTHADLSLAVRPSSLEPERQGPIPSVLVCVADSGPGLDPNTLDQLFDPFYTTKPNGLGMGLAISRSIVEAHGGRLWATANVPRGAVFQFTLPIADAPAYWQ